MKKIFGLGMVFALLLMASTAAADFVTPDTGTTYSLSQLAAISSGAIEALPQGAYLVHEKVIISKTDALEAKNSALLFNVPDEIPAPQTYKNPCLIVKGYLAANNMIFTTNPDSIVDYRLGTEIRISGEEPGSLAEASLTSCTFHTLMVGLSVGCEAKLTMKESHFDGCRQAGMNVFGNSNAYIQNTVFENSPCVFQESNVVILGCEFDGGGMNLCNCLEGSMVKGCQFHDCTDNGISIVSDNSTIENNDVLQSLFGISVWGNSAGTIQNNTISENYNGGLVVMDQAAPKIRKNTFDNNALNPPVTSGTLVLPAVFIYDEAMPDLGTKNDPGENIFGDNGLLNVYHAGKKIVYALGNDWGAQSQLEIEDAIYHRLDDSEDADLSGFLSGWVVYSDIFGFPLSRGVISY